MPKLNRLILNSFKCQNVKIIILIIFICALFIFLTHPGRFASRYPHVPDGEIEKYLLPSRSIDEGTCALLPNLSMSVQDAGYVPSYNVTSWASIHHINLGGWWAPDSCEPVHQVALVIPYRDRPKQLSTFLQYMHTFLQSQLLNYRIFIVEQAYGKSFNRGKLMNVGFKEAQKLQAFHCFIFHDIDLLPQVQKNIYGCAKLPRHMSSSINIWRYNLLYHGAFGGAIAISAEQFKLINGFSNIYFGWGAEDDDLLMRIKVNGLDIVRFSPEVSRYLMLPHRSETKNPDRFSMLSVAATRFREDGLNSLNYRVLSYQIESLYTHIIVQL